MNRSFPSDIALRQIHMKAHARFHALGFLSQTAAVEVGELHYLIRKGGPDLGTVVFVHGIGTSSNTWLRTIPHLNDRRTFIALDLPGFGFSTVKRSEGFAAFRDHERALAEFLDHHVSGPLTLAGHSFGAWISAKYAATHPDKVRHLILINSAGVYFRGIEQLREMFVLKSASDTKRLLTTMWYRYPWFVKPFTGAIHRELMRRRMNDVVTSIQADDLLVEELSRLAMPVSLIWGRRDGIIPLEVVDTIIRLVPRCEVFFIEQCGHVPQLEKPAQFTKTLDQVLRTVK